MRTRREVILSTIGYIAVPSASFAADASQTIRNGFWWERMQAGHRILYAAGFLDGLSEENEQWQLATQSIGNKTHRTVHLSPSSKPAVDYADFSGIAHGQLVDGLNEFFEDYRNKRIHVADALMYVKNEIKGVSAELQKRNLQIMREVATRDDYDQ